MLLAVEGSNWTPKSEMPGLLVVWIELDPSLWPTKPNPRFTFAAGGAGGGQDSVSLVSSEESHGNQAASQGKASYVMVGLTRKSHS